MDASNAGDVVREIVERGWNLGELEVIDEVLTTTRSVRRHLDLSRRRWATGSSCRAVAG